MAGNNSIQILRGNTNVSTEIALDGQPVYNPSSGYLYIGDNSTQIKDLEAVKASYANVAANIDGSNVYINAQNILNINSSNLNISMSTLNIGGNTQDAPSYIEFTSPISICAPYGMNLNSSNIEIGNGSHNLTITPEYMFITTSGNQLLFPSKSGTIALTSDIKSPTVTNNSDGTVNITFD